MANAKSSISVFDKEISVVGNISSSGSVDVSGIIKGTVVVGTLSVKEGGKIDGDVFANKIVMANNGNIIGNVVAGKIVMAKNSCIKGNVKYNTLSMEDEAILDGECSRINNEDLDQAMQKIMQNNNTSGFHLDETD